MNERTNERRLFIAGKDQDEDEDDDDDERWTKQAEGFGKTANTYLQVDTRRRRLILARQLASRPHVYNNDHKGSRCPIIAHAYL